MITLLIATGNLHKVEEIRAILGTGFIYRTLAELPAPPKVKEDAATFAGNATKKAVEIANWVACSIAHGKAALDWSWTTDPEQTAPRVFVLADDSGLEVDFLNGAPGVHSARFAALDSGQPDNSSSEANNAKLLRALVGVSPAMRTARFRCVVALAPVMAPMRENASPVCFAEESELGAELFEGACEGRIGFAASGQDGFGYDPLFLPEGYEKTFAELGEEEKNRMSHRAKALAKLRLRLQATTS
jgi:XTP/dITP diphosphohydrolase